MTCLFLEVVPYSFYALPDELSQSLNANVKAYISLELNHFYIRFRIRSALCGHLSILIIFSIMQGKVYLIY